MANIQTAAAVAATGMKTGSYIGDGGIDHHVDIGVDLEAKSEKLVMVRGDLAEAPVFKTKDMGSISSFSFAALMVSSTGITGFTSTGFTLNNSAAANQDTETYYYVALWKN